MSFLARLDIDLQRGLSIELNGDVHHIASFVQAIRRGISPSTRQVDAHRATSPYNLVGIDIEARSLFLGQDSFGQTFTHQGECLVFFLLIGFAFELVDTGTEHPVADASHHRHGIGKGLWQRKLMERILTGSIFQIELIEHTTFVVLCQNIPIGNTEGFTLGSETTQVGVCRNLVSRELAGFHPSVLTFLQGRFGHHPAHQKAQFIDGTGYREDTGRLKVVRQFHILQGQATN